ncbi:tetraspanin [Diaporthe helianthi]|uniref:Tetraspanin n=1 Tax=Diaporthe helianthi TaxID=158607 RepID=A0A2P5HRG3_DIAHE|nr:tetraspanin [Diaporthe helianthi]
MVNKVLGAYVAADFLFVVTGAILVGFSVIVQNFMFETPTEGAQAVRNLLYQEFPLTAGIVNGVLVFITFAFTLPAIAMPTRGWLKLSGYMLVVNAVFSVILGLYLWILTLRTRETLSPLWNAQPPKVQGLMQTTFACCGYFNSTSPAFVTDPTCPSPAAASLMRGCAGPLSSFANVFIDNIFTAVFGMAGIDGVLILATACLLKDRKERERFRYIDSKTQSSTF